MHDYQNDPEFRELMENAQAEARSSTRMLAFSMIAVVIVLGVLLLYFLMLKH